MAQELYGSEKRLMLMALNNPTIQVIYEDTRQTARRLMEHGYLEPSGDDFRITQKGVDLMRSGSQPSPTPIATAPAPLNDTPQPRRGRKPMLRIVKRLNDTPRARRGRKPMGTHQTQEVKESARPKQFSQLSTRQQNILHFIDRFVGTFGYPPTRREIGNETGIPSTSVVDYNIKRLEQWGWLGCTEGVSRGVRLTQTLPGKKAKNDIQVTHGVLKISVNLMGDPDDVIEMAQAAIDRLKGVIATAKEMTKNP
jgi:hypothetical protein